MYEERALRKGYSSSNDFHDWKYKLATIIDDSDKNYTVIRELWNSYFPYVEESVKRTPYAKILGEGVFEMLIGTESK